MNQRLPIRHEITEYRRPGSDVQVRSMAEGELTATQIESLLKTGHIALEPVNDPDPKRAEPESTPVAMAFDHLLGLAWGTYGFRNAAGDWICRDIDGSGLGKMGLRIIQALQLNAGVSLRPCDIAGLVGNRRLATNNVLAARLKAIRSAHDESGERQRFFLSRRNGGYSLKWPSEFSWIWVDRII